MKYNTIIWDMDGTLLNTLDDLTDCANTALRKFGYPERSISETRLFVGKGLRHMFSCCVPEDISESDFDTAFEFFKEFYVSHNSIKTAPYDGAADILKKLKSDGFRMAIVSNKADAALNILARKFFGDSIDYVIGEQPSLEKKPAPDMVMKALSELGAEKNDAVYIGDSDVDLATANNSELPCISVLWGFRTKEELSAKGADTFCSSFDELYDYLHS